MTKKKGFVYLSILPVILVVIIIGIAGYLLLADEIKFPNTDNKPKPRRLEGFPTVVITDKQLEKGKAIITNETELNNYLNQIDSSGMLVLRDKVDFNKEIILAANSQTRTEENTSIKIKKVYQDTKKKKLNVEIHEVIPDSDCAVRTDPHIAVDLVALTKTDFTIEFDRVRDTPYCGIETTETNSPNSNNK